jgi:hypothetical protein
MSRQEQFKKQKEVQADEIPEQNQRRFFVLLQHLGVYLETRLNLDCCSMAH